MHRRRPLAPLPRLRRRTSNFIDRHILRTQRSLKLVDFSSWLLTLAIGLLAFVLVAAVLDQWVVAGGLSPLPRGVLFLAFFTTIAWHSWRTLLPLIRTINPVYAAQTIESSSPGLKNSLLNLLLFRSERRPMSQRVYQAIEHQAAQRLSTARAESAVDRTPLLRLGYALLAAFATVALYAALSPKNPLVSAGRVLAPWADIAVPSRVRILDITPGDSAAARGERVEISAEITGAGADEPMRLHYASLDRQIEDEQVTMSRSGGGARVAARIPAGPAGAPGIEQDLEYWIEAGDARSRHYKLSVFSRPTIVVQKVRYEPPSYTGDPSSETSDTGDLRGLEGTRVTLEALSNQPLRAAQVDFDADGSRDLSMQVAGDRATVTFTLALREDRRTPLHPRYALRISTTEGRTNDDPAIYRIDVTPDYPPEVRITKPEKEESQARVGDIVQIGVEARDVDFALSGVKLVGRVGERDVAIGDVLSDRHEGRFGGIKPFVPGDVQLKAGEVLEYWAEASDDRRPEANVTKSDRRRLRIVEGAGGGKESGDRGQGSGDKSQESGGGEPDAAHNGDQQQGGQQQGGQQTGGQQQGGQQQGEQQKGGQQKDGQQKGGQQKGGQQKDGQQKGGQQKGGQQQGGQPQGGQQGGQKQSGGQQKGGAPQPGQSGEAGKESQSPDGSNSSGDQQGQPGDKQSSDQAGGQSSAGGQPQERVSSDGSDDGKAFQKIQNQFGKDDANKGGGQESGDGSQESGDRGQESGAGENQKPGDDKSVSRDAKSAERSAQDGNQSEQSAVGKNASTSGKQSAAGKQKAGESTDPQPDGAGKDRATADPAAGDKRPGADKAHQDKSGDGDPTKKSTGEAPDSAMNQNQGDAGSGQDTGNENGSPQGKTSINRPKSDKDKNNPEGMDDQEPPSAGQDNKEGQSHGGQGGDATGGGQEGGGQHADAQGKGDAGQHESADEGAGQSTESGNGETGDQAGDDKIAPGKTGSEQKSATGGRGKESGDGNQESAGGGQESGAKGQQSSGGKEQPPGADNPVSRDAESAERSAPNEDDQAKNPEGDSPAKSDPSEANSKSANPGEQPSGEQGAQPGQQGDKSSGQSGESSSSEGASPQSKSPQEKSQSNSSGGSSGPNNGGTAGTRKSSAPAGSPPPEQPGQADAANLEFAKKQTDLLLERLDEQLAKHKVDPALLRSLGWSEEELSRFVDRWKGLKDRAAGQGEDATKAQKELAEALRSLGLRPGGPRRIDAAAADDRLRNLNEGYRTRAPLEYADRIRAYVKRSSTSEGD